MAEIRIDLDSKGIEQMLCSTSVKDELDRIAKAIATSAGEGMRYETVIGKTDRHGGRRMRSTVWTGTYAARIAEAEDRTLLRALDAGRS